MLERSTPRSFVRSGYIYLSNNSIRDLARSTSNWSSSAGDYKDSLWGISAYYLEFASIGGNASDLYPRWFGRPVRCLVYVVNAGKGFL